MGVKRAQGLQSGKRSKREWLVTFPKMPMNLLTDTIISSSFELLKPARVGWTMDKFLAIVLVEVSLICFFLLLCFGTFGKPQYFLKPERKQIKKTLSVRLCHVCMCIVFLVQGYFGVFTFEFVSIGINQV